MRSTINHLALKRTNAWRHQGQLNNVPVGQQLSEIRLTTQSKVSQPTVVAVSCKSDTAAQRLDRQ